MTNERDGQSGIVVSPSPKESHVILTSEQVQEALERASGAVEGPWNYRREGRGSGKEDRIVEVMHTCDDPNSCETSEDYPGCVRGHVVLREDATPHWANRLHDERNWKFIAAARTDVPALCRSHEALRAQLELISGARAEMQRCFESGVDVGMAWMDKAQKSESTIAALRAENAKALELLERFVTKNEELPPPDAHWYQEYFELTGDGEHMILTDEGWEPGANKQSYLDEYGTEAIHLYGTEAIHLELNAPAALSVQPSSSEKVLGENLTTVEASPSPEIVKEGE